jgi:hypothetical protein
MRTDTLRTEPFGGFFHAAGKPWDLYADDFNYFGEATLAFRTPSVPIGLAG